MGANFSSTEELRLYCLEQGRNSDLQRLANDEKRIAALEQSFQQLAGLQGSQGGGDSGGAFWYGTVGASGIPAASGGTAGSGDVTLLDLNKDGSMPTLKTVTCFNGAPFDIAPNTIIVVGRNSKGLYMQINNVCPEEA